MSNKHWYCVSQVGAATLCVNRQDAMEAAREGDMLWPQHAPHYVARLERVKPTPLAQRKIQSIIDSGEYREMKGATVLVSENGHAAIVNHRGAFYWVDNEGLAREFEAAGAENTGEK